VYLNPRSVVLICSLAVGACESSATDAGGSNAGGGNVGGSNEGAANEGGSNNTGAGNTGGFSNEPGTIETSSLPLPSGLANACENPWTIRLLTYHPGAVVPRRIYTASCTPPGGSPKIWASLSTHPEGTQDPYTRAAGAIFEAALDETTGALVPTGVQREFEECEEMHGIAVKSDCSRVAALCRRPSRESETAEFTKDLIAELPDEGIKGWLTQPGSEESGQVNGEEWLYEWPSGDVSASPSTYVVHKAIGGWTYGSQHLIHGEVDDSYAVSLKATVFGGGSWHQGDSMLVVDRSTFSIDLQRGWYWGCAPGHTIFNHATFNPTTSQYAATCGTDLGTDPDAEGHFSGLWMHTESNETVGYLTTPLYEWLTFGGGPTSLLPLADGGYLGVFAGTTGNTITSNMAFGEQGPLTTIGLVRFDSSGAVVGDLKIVAAMPNTFLSYPQLASLGNGTYLLGYAEMDALGGEGNDAFRVPKSFRVQEIDENGNALTEAQTLDGAGWGEQDQMVPLGEGRVGWVYIPNPERVDGVNPPCSSTSLALSVYTQKFGGARSAGGELSPPNK
jgi:hypothetical protein